MHATLEEDKCSKCMRVTDYLGMMSDAELVQAMQCTTQWPETIKQSDVIRDFMKKMDSEFLRRKAAFEYKEQLELAFGLSCLHFLSYLKFPFSVLKSAMEQTQLGCQTKEEVTVLSLLSCACAHQVDSAFIGQWKQIGEHFQHHVVEHFDDYDPVELGVCLAGLKVISGQPSEELKLKAENRYGFRFWTLWTCWGSSFWCSVCSVVILALRLFTIKAEKLDTSYILSVSDKWRRSRMNVVSTTCTLGKDAREAIRIVFEVTVSTISG